MCIYAIVCLYFVVCLKSFVYCTVVYILWLLSAVYIYRVKLDSLRLTNCKRLFEIGERDTRTHAVAVAEEKYFTKGNGGRAHTRSRPVLCICLYI